ncbi:MAG: GC-type dockerin domain-anchored protein [Phycisphaerales bacterium]
MIDRTLVTSLACVALGASAASAQLAVPDPYDVANEDAATTDPRGFSSGPDVIYQQVLSIDTAGPVGGKMGYIGDSYTCNIGDTPMVFGFSANGSPALTFNLYRLMNGRLEQIGLSWVKHACCAAQGSGCGLSCSPAGGLGPGCRDIYSAGWNAIQSNLGPRSLINAYTGNIPGTSGVGGSTIAGRLQATQSDLQMEGAGASYYFEGVYVASDDAPAGNAYNNASYRPVNVNQSTLSMSTAGTMFTGTPAIYAWQNADPSVVIVPVDIPGEGRLHVAAKVSENGDGTYHYEYAVYNLNSHRSVGSVSVPVSSAGNVGFHDVDYHSGEPYDNTDWSVSTDGNAVTWSSPQTFAQNQNSNAIRWATMYNFWFDATTGPTDGEVTLGLFRPGTPDSVNVPLPVPQSGGCNGADLAEPFGQLDFTDVTTYLAAFGSMLPEADLAVPFGQFDINDVIEFLTQFGAGCP